jgi:hypothetical protein
MGHNLGNYPQGYAQVHCWRKLGCFWKNGAIFWRNRAIFGDRSRRSQGAGRNLVLPWKVSGPPRRRFRPCFAISRFAGSPSRTDPARKLQGEVNHHDGGRGVYFEDINGHLLEVITRPYGSGGSNP